MKTMTWMAVALIAVAALVAAQGVMTSDPARAAVERQAVAGKQMAADKALLDAQQVKARAAVQARITRGAPYSADTTTESIQTLADGNRIVDRRVTRVYRDVEGRTRTEQFDTTGQAVSVSISDPVLGRSFTLNPQARTAFESNVLMVQGFVVALDEAGVLAAKKAAAEAGAVVAQKTELEAVKKRQAEEAATMAPRTVAPVAVPGVSAGGLAMKVPDNADVKREDLGQQVLSGVAATGTRVTTVIPAGAMGNEHPIQIVSEQWFSSDLQVLVQTRHSDPRTGDTTYQLTNVVRADQPHSLFEVPADYTMQQSVIRRDAKR